MQILEYKAAAEPATIVSVNEIINVKVGRKQPELILTDKSYLIFGCIDLYNTMMRDPNIYKGTANQFNIEEFMDHMKIDDVDPNTYKYRNTKICEAELYDMSKVYETKSPNEYYILRLYC